MTVDLLVWTDTDALALVDGARVRIRRGPSGVRWCCSSCGESLDQPDHCPHTAALAASPAHHDKYRQRQPRGRRTNREGAPAHV